MRVLTVRQPWASAILYLGKTVENRPLVWTYTGDLAIHAGKEWDLTAFTDRAFLGALTRHGLDAGRVRAGLEASRFPTSAILGVVQMVGAHRSDVGCCPGNPWARWPEQGQEYLGHHILRNPQPFRDPIPASGRLGLWKPGEYLEADIREALTEGARQ